MVTERTCACSQCTTKSGSRRLTFQNSLCRLYRSILGPQEAERGIKQNSQAGEIQIYIAVLWFQMMPATSICGAFDSLDMN